MRLGRLAALLAALTLPGTGWADTSLKILSYSDLQGWEEDDHPAALAAFLNTCPLLTAPDWQTLCAVAGQQTNARTFFELFFTPVMVEDGSSPLFTGYFEPELSGALSPTSRYRYPIYGMPSEARAQPWLSRREIETSGILNGRGLEIA